MKWLHSSPLFKIALLALPCLLLAQLSTAQLTTNKPQRLEKPLSGPALDRLLLLEPVAVDYTLPGKSISHSYYGFQAEKFKTAFPELASVRPYSYSVGKNKYRTAGIVEMDMPALIPILVAAMQELRAELESLKQQLAKPETGTAPAAQ